MTQPIRKAALGAAMAVALVGAAGAESPVLVELFTSQGCSSCPPADALLREFARRDDVIALGLHVDYWDYLGWTDEFARPEHTKRQKAYSRAHDDRMIYTPQMVVDGIARLPGNRALAVQRAIDERQMLKPEGPDIAIERHGKTVGITAGAERLPDGAVDVMVVAFRPRAAVSVEGGENAGHHLEYANVVSRMVPVGQWDGTSRLDLSIEMPEGPVAVFLQKPGMGEVIAAAQLR